MTIDWDSLFSEEGIQRCDSHVLLWYGYDLTAAGILQNDIAPCLFCPPTLRREDDPVVCITEETLHWGKRILFVSCGQCGTRGPWARTESEALAWWNNAYQRKQTAIQGGAA